jgi:hypothetical protein
MNILIAKFKSNGDKYVIFRPLWQENALDKCRILGSHEGGYEEF